MMAVLHMAQDSEQKKQDMGIEETKKEDDQERHDPQVFEARRVQFKLR